MGGIDIGYNGRRYTWENKQKGNALIKERLDRAIACKDWLDMQPTALVQHFGMEISDHCPQEGDKVKIIKRPFSFVQAWTTDESSVQVVNRAQNSDSKGGMLCRRIKRSLWITTKVLQNWNRQEFGYTHVCMKKLEAELKILQNSERDEDRQRQIMEGLIVQWAKTESICRQKSWELWLKEGDKNTKKNSFKHFDPTEEKPN